jgi:tetratricopeptide (TPR) repeat protein
MFLTRHHVPLAMELVKWLVLIIAALALMVLLANAVAAEPMEPNRLPDDMGLLAKPIEPPQIKPYFPEELPTLPLAPEAAAARLWMILEQQRAGQMAEAIAAWQTLPMPAEADVWRQVAIAAAHLQRGDLGLAQKHLELARETAPDQAVVAYYMGVLRLEQAEAALVVPDELTEGRLRMVAHVPARGVMANVLLKALARTELHMAVARAAEVRLDERLIAGDADMEERIVVPCVGDLLVALEADNFVGKAHHLLFGLELERGQAAGAEEHLDLAVATGIAPLYGYADLAEVYLAQGNEPAALRAGRKDLAANYPLLWQAGQEMQDAIQGVWEGWVW